MPPWSGSAILVTYSICNSAFNLGVVDLGWQQSDSSYPGFILKNYNNQSNGQGGTTISSLFADDYGRTVWIDSKLSSGYDNIYLSEANGIVSDWDGKKNPENGKRILASSNIEINC